MLIHARPVIGPVCFLALAATPAICMVYPSPNVFINLVIVGDFNINYLSTPNYLHDRLSSVMSSFNLLQVVSEPTRISTTSSLTDLVFVSSPNMVHLCETIPPLATSDHLGIHLILSTKLHKSDLRSHCRKLWRYDQANFDQAIDLLDSIEWRLWICPSHIPQLRPRRIFHG